MGVGKKWNPLSLLDPPAAKVCAPQKRCRIFCSGSGSFAQGPDLLLKILDLLQKIRIFKKNLDLKKKIGSPKSGAGSLAEDPDLQNKFCT